MSLVLEEFYAQVLSVGVSATTKKGFDEKLLATFDKAKEEYDAVFLPELMKKLSVHDEKGTADTSKDEEKSTEKEKTAAN